MAKKLKIALTCPASLPATQFGGILFLCTDIARELAKKNHIITIYTTDLDFENGTNLFNKKLSRVENYDGFTIKRTHAFLKIKLFFVNPGIFMQIKKDMPDLIHVVGIRSFQAIIGAILSKMYDIPLVISDQGGLFTHPDFKKDRITSYLYKLQEPFIKFIIKQAKKIIAANEYEQTIFSKYCTKSKILLVKNGINFEQITTIPFDFKKKYKISGRMILFVGRFSKIKGIDLLLDAFSDICKLKEFDNVMLVILGVDFGYQGDMMKKIQNLKIQNRIKIIQKPPREDVIASYHACEFAVLPSKWEMSPLTPLEVFSCKKTVISTNAYGIPYVVVNGKNGLLVPANNPKKITECIIKLLDNDKMRYRLGNEGFKMVEKECNSKVMAQQILQVYLSILNK